MLHSSPFLQVHQLRSRLDRRRIKVSKVADRLVLQLKDSKRNAYLFLIILTYYGRVVFLLLLTFFTLLLMLKLVSLLIMCFVYIYNYFTLKYHVILSQKVPYKICFYVLHKLNYFRKRQSTYVVFTFMKHLILLM